MFPLVFVGSVALTYKEKGECLMATMTNKNNGGTVASTGRAIYEGKVGTEAVIRSGGKNPQLKGVVHEILYRDSINATPANLANGTKATLSKSATAVRDDILKMNGGQVVGRAQLKDTASSISKTVKQAASGKYAGTNLMGTKETVNAYNKAIDSMKAAGKQVPQKMTSTGISSMDTSRIATQTIGGKVSSAALKKCAASSAGAGAALSAGIEVLSSGSKLAKGEISGEDFICNVTKETISGAATAAAASTASAMVSTAAASFLATTAAPVFVPAAIGVGAAIVVGSKVKSFLGSIL